MATDKQLTANRANALHSTGPKTEAGRTATSQNAVKHNLTSKNLIIVPGQEDSFAELESGLRSKLSPQGPLEEVLYKRVVECAWNLERCRMAEVQLQINTKETHLDPLLSDRCEACYTRVHRYSRESENSMYKAMRELGKLQTEAQYRQEICPLTPEQKDDPAEVAQTVHSLSQTCFLSQIMKHVLAFHQASQTANTTATRRQLEALSTLHPLEIEARIKANSPAMPPPLLPELVQAAAA